MVNPLVVIGLDGFTWEVADRLNLPNISKITKNGGRTELESTLPAVTCPAWPTFLTGKSPENHQAYDFAFLNTDKELELTNYSQINSPGLIEVTAREQLPAIFFEIPVTFPAPDSGSTVISGYPSENTQEKFSPTKLKKQLEDKFGSFPPISPGRYSGRNKETVVEKFTAATRYRRDAFCHLLDRRDWKLAACNFYLGDQFSHYFWSEFEKNDNSKDPLSQAYKLLDDVVGKIKSTIPSNTNLLVMSDHGHGRQERMINLNYLLWRQNHLQFKSSFATRIKKLLFKTGLTPLNLKNLADRLNISPLLSKLSREKRDQMLNSFLSYEDIDWDNTEAFALGHMGQIFWIGENENRLKILKQTLRKSFDNSEINLDELITLRDNLPAPSSRAPAFLTKLDNWKTLAYPMLMSSYKLLEKPVYSGSHRPEGILAWEGPDLTASELKEAQIADLAPTIHRLLNLPPQPDFDGSALSEILSESAPDTNPPRDYRKKAKQDGEKETEEQVEQLKNLGYL